MKNLLRFLNGSVHFVLFKRLMIILVMYSACRIGFYLYNLDNFGHLTFAQLSYMMLGGLKFDISAIIYTNLLFIVLHILPFRFREKKLYQKLLMWIFYIFNFIALTFNMSDFIYYKFTFKRTTLGLFKEFGSNTNIFKLLSNFIFDYWYASAFGIVVFAIIIFLYRKTKIEKTYILNKNLYFLFHTVMMVVVAGLCVAGMRGGFKHSTRPITLSNASKYINKPQERAIVLNTPFAMIRSANSVKLKKMHYFPEEEAKAIFNAEHTFTKDSTDKKLNIVVLVVESMAKEHLGFYNKNIEGYKGYTPFLDSLCNHAYVCQESYANANKSINALPSTLCSIPSFKDAFILSNYSGNKINSIGSLLKKDGYYSAFFHGAPNGSMGFDAFIKQAGYDAYFGKTEYNNDKDFDGMWGIWDEPFLQYFANTMDTFKQPFVSTVFTLSSHHPYKVPKKYKGVFPKGHLPVQKAIGYTDNAIRKFFATASKMDWYKNTVFIIQADHSISPYLKEYRNTRGRKAIPIIIYKPGDENFVKYDPNKVIQQADVLPTLLNMVGYEGKCICFGNDILDPNKDHFAISYQGGAYNITMDGYLLQFDGKKSIGLYDIKERYLETNLLGSLPEVQNKLENKIKAIIQEYNSRMIDNKLSE